MIKNQKWERKKDQNTRYCWYLPKKYTFKKKWHNYSCYKLPVFAL